MQAAYYGDDLGGIPEAHWCYQFYRRLFLQFDDAEFAGMYQAGGRYPVSPRLLMCISVLQYMFGHSDRQAIEQTICNRHWRIALGIEPGYAGFDHTVLVHFRQRLLVARQERLVFDKVLQVAAHEGLLTGRKQVRIDATHLLANVAWLSRADMIAETIRLVVRELHKRCRHLHENLTFMRLYERYGEEVWLGKDRASPSRLIELGRDGYTVLEFSATKKIPNKHLLARVLEENYLFPPEDGDPVPKAQEDLPADHLVSPHDPDVEVGKKDDRLWNGDKVHLVETVAPDGTGFIVDVETTGPRVPDVHMLPELAERMKFIAPQVDTMLADGGYASAANTQYAADLGQDLVTPPRMDNTRGIFPARAFTYDFERRVATCPAGHESRYWYTTQSRARIRIRFRASDCAACPRHAQCTTSCGARTLTLSRDFEQLCQDRQRAATPAFAELYRRRAGIEGTISELVRCCGLRRSRYRGSPKRRLHALLAATALNVRRLLRRRGAGDQATAPHHTVFSTVRTWLRSGLLRPAEGVWAAA